MLGLKAAFLKSFATEGAFWLALSWGEACFVPIGIASFFFELYDSPFRIFASRKRQHLLPKRITQYCNKMEKSTPRKWKSRLGFGRKKAVTGNNKAFFSTPVEADNGEARSLSTKRNQRLQQKSEKKRGGNMIRKLQIKTRNMRESRDASDTSNPQSPYSNDSYEVSKKWWGGRNNRFYYVVLPQNLTVFVALSSLQSIHSLTWKKRSKITVT